MSEIPTKAELLKRLERLEGLMSLPEGQDESFYGLEKRIASLEQWRDAAIKDLQEREQRFNDLVKRVDVAAAEAVEALQRVSPPEQVYQNLEQRVEALEEGWSTESSIDEALIRRAVAPLEERLDVLERAAPAVDDMLDQRVANLATSHEALEGGLDHVTGRLVLCENRLDAQEEGAAAKGWVKALEERVGGLSERLGLLVDGQDQRLEVLEPEVKSLSQLWEALSARVDGWERPAVNDLEKRLDAQEDGSASKAWVRVLESRIAKLERPPPGLGCGELGDRLAALEKERPPSVEQEMVGIERMRGNESRISQLERICGPIDGEIHLRFVALEDKLTETTNWIKVAEDLEQKIRALMGNDLPVHRVGEVERRLMSYQEGEDARVHALVTRHWGSGWVSEEQLKRTNDYVEGIEQRVQGLANWVEDLREKDRTEEIINRLVTLEAAVCNGTTRMDMLRGQMSEWIIGVEERVSTLEENAQRDRAEDVEYADSVNARLERLEGGRAQEGHGFPDVMSVHHGLGVVRRAQEDLEKRLGDLVAAMADEDDPGPKLIFIYRGTTYATLTPIAVEISGSRNWSGKRFFRVKDVEAGQLLEREWAGETHRVHVKLDPQSASSEGDRGLVSLFEPGERAHLVKLQSSRMSLVHPHPDPAWVMEDFVGFVSVHQMAVVGDEAARLELRGDCLKDWKTVGDIRVAILGENAAAAGKVNATEAGGIRPEGLFEPAISVIVYEVRRHRDKAH